MILKSKKKISLQANDFNEDNTAMNEYELEKVEQDYKNINLDLSASNRYKDRKIFPRYIEASTLSDNINEHFKHQYNHLEKYKNDWSLQDTGPHVHNEKKW